MLELLNPFFDALNFFEDFLWGYLAMPLLMGLGILLTIQSKFMQIRQFPTVLRTFAGFFSRSEHKGGVHPLKVFFACIGGCVGVGNIVGICTAVQVGGPGALLWIWVTAILGMMLKYAEVYLGMRYRVQREDGRYDGGPMFFLKQVFKGPLVPNIVCVLLCIYGVEVYQFSVITSAITENTGISFYVVIPILLALVMFAGSGGVQRVGNISSAMIPVFVTIYVGMTAWVLLNNLTVLPTVAHDVFVSAFSGSAALGGFVGSTMMIAMSQGVRRGCYTGDLGVGYASVIHSESSETIPEKQASLVIFEIFLDAFVICTSSVVVILATGVWHADLPTSMLVQTALADYFPYMHFFMPLFLFLLGYSTINAYFCVGLKSAEFLSPKNGRPIYYVYAIVSLLLFSFVETALAQTVMTIAGGLLLLINCYGIFRLRHEISFELDEGKVDPELAPFFTSR